VFPENTECRTPESSQFLSKINPIIQGKWTAPGRGFFHGMWRDEEVHVDRQGPNDIAETLFVYFMWKVTLASHVVMLSLSPQSCFFIQ
jgi:hypothetical protein